MRYILSAAAAAAALCLAVAPALAGSQDQSRDEGERDEHRIKRVRSHVSLHLSTHAVLDGNGLKVRGRVRPRGRHRVKIVVRGSEPAVRKLRTRRNGSFALRWVPGDTGNYKVRAHKVHDRRARAARSAGRRLTSYRHAHASYYGPGLYGNGVACGGTLTPGTMGVAHKTLPCGTKVKFRYRGRSVTVPVIDRGPYVAGREYDLTEAVKHRLRFPGIGTVLTSR